MKSDGDSSVIFLFTLPMVADTTASAAAVCSSVGCKTAFTGGTEASTTLVVATLSENSLDPSKRTVARPFEETSGELGIFDLLSRSVGSRKISG